MRNLIMLLLLLQYSVESFLLPQLPQSSSSIVRSTSRSFPGLTRLQAKTGSSPFSFFAGGIALAPANKKGGRGVNAVKRYFQLWNERKMTEAIELFTEDCQYEDTLYPGKFEGKEKLKAHLLKVADALPDSFSFVLDDISDGGESIGVQWHVESDGAELPFTRGASMYKVDPASGLITSGFDVPEPTIKSGSVNLAVLSLVGKLLETPVRVIPFALWGFYCWFLFLSNVAPGPNALALDPATWQEVKDLSLNFWLIVPALFPSKAPVLHPILEGVFNLLLAWAAMFAGFMIDGRTVAPGPNSSPEAIEGKERKNALLPYVLGMQALTNAVLLPYLVLRPTKPWSPQTSVKKVPFTKAEAFGESRLPPLVFLAVGIFSIAWALIAREADFGDLSQRIPSFVELFSCDRLTFSIVIDLIYFWGFQGWLMDDDMKRRATTSGKGPNMLLAKTIPFFGLAYYFLTRPALDLPQEE